MEGPRSLPPPDLDSVINVILPLELYKHPAFPSEAAFDHLLVELTALPVRQQSPASNNLCVTREMLICAATILAEKSVTMPVHQALVLVLRKLRRWRLIPADEDGRSTPSLACLLADILNHSVLESQKSATHTRSSHDQLTDNKADGHHGALEQVQPPSLPCHTLSAALSQPLQQWTDFRNGCSACRRPRPSLALEATSLKNCQPRHSPILQGLGSPGSNLLQGQLVPAISADILPTASTQSLLHRSSVALFIKQKNENAIPLITSESTHEGVIYEYSASLDSAALPDASSNKPAIPFYPRTPSKPKSRKAHPKTASRALALSSPAFNASRLADPVNGHAAFSSSSSHVSKKSLASKENRTVDASSACKVKVPPRRAALSPSGDQMRSWRP